MNGGSVKFTIFPPYIQMKYYPNKMEKYTASKSYFDVSRKADKSN